MRSEKEEIKNNIKCLKEIKSNTRDASFDFCYNYFYSFYKKGKLSELANKNNLEMSCLQLGFFLASWGMLRPSAALLQKSVKCFSNLVIKISESDPKLWEIDVPNYNDGENINLLRKCKKTIEETLEKTTDTLITKIMLGVFGNVPAYDTNFTKFLKEKGYCQTFNKKSLNEIKEFYEEHKPFFNHSKIHTTIDFLTSKKTKQTYSISRLIDMHDYKYSESKISEDEKSKSKRK